MNHTLPDTTAKDSIDRVMLSSSKSAIIIDKKPSFLDSIKKTGAGKFAPKKETSFLSSSKSSLVIYPDSSFKVRVDSLLKLKTDKKKKAP